MRQSRVEMKCRSCCSESVTYICAKKEGRSSAPSIEEARSSPTPSSTVLEGVVQGCTSSIESAEERPSFFAQICDTRGARIFSRPCNFFYTIQLGDPWSVLATKMAENTWFRPQLTSTRLTRPNWCGCYILPPIRRGCLAACSQDPSGRATPAGKPWAPPGTRCGPSGATPVAA